MTRFALAFISGCGLIAVAYQGLVAQISSPVSGTTDARDARDALASARQQQRNARSRAEQLERQAAQSREAEEKALQEAAALAARVQQAEAAIAAAEAELALIEDRRRVLDGRLAERREPLARLTGALHAMSSRPLALTALQPGSLNDLVHTRAVLSGAIPVVRRRTAGLREDLDRVRTLETRRRIALAERREAESRLEARRRDLVARAEQERILARRARGGARREAERAIELAEEARDLDTLVAQMEGAAALRARLAALDGPVPRPQDPRNAKSLSARSPRAAATAPVRFLLPVTGRVARGFGETSAAGARSTDILLLPRPGAQVVSPAAGRVVFAGPYEGYGTIIIVEHDGGWTSVVTGLSRASVEVGQEITAGSPLGLAGSRAPRVSYELRRGGTPVNPLDFAD